MAITAEEGKNSLTIRNVRSRPGEDAAPELYVLKNGRALNYELDCIDSMFKGPGYIPALDHLIHPEISYGDFKYFVSELRKRIDKYADI